MAIEDLIANPQVANLGQQFLSGMQTAAVTQGIRSDNTLKELKIQETIRNQELADLERRAKVKRAKHEVNTMDTQLKMEDGVKHMAYTAAQFEQVAQDIGTVTDQKSYESFLNHYQTSYGGDIAPFKKEDGTMKTFEEAQGDLSTLQQAGVYNADTMRKLLQYQAQSSEGIKPSDAAKRRAELVALGYPAWYADRVAYGMYRMVRDDATGDMVLVDISQGIDNPRPAGEDESGMLGGALNGVQGPLVTVPGAKREREISENQVKLGDDLQKSGTVEFLDTITTLRQLIEESGAVDEHGKLTGDIPGFGLGRYDFTRKTRANFGSDTALLAQSITNQFQKLKNVQIKEYAGTASTVAEMERQRLALEDAWNSGDRIVYDVIQKLERATRNNAAAIMSAYSSTPESVRRWQESTGQWFFKPGHVLGPQIKPKGK